MWRLAQICESIRVALTHLAVRRHLGNLTYPSPWNTSYAKGVVARSGAMLLINRFWRCIEVVGFWGLLVAYSASVEFISRGQH